MNQLSPHIMRPQKEISAPVVLNDIQNPPALLVVTLEEDLREGVPLVHNGTCAKCFLKKNAYQIKYNICKITKHAYKTITSTKTSNTHTARSRQSTNSRRPGRPTSRLYWSAPSSAGQRRAWNHASEGGLVSIIHFKWKNHIEWLANG